MRLLLHILLLSCCLFAQAQGQHVVLLAKDSLPMDLDKGWLYTNGDNPAWAQPAYADAAWQEVNTDSIVSQNKSALFTGIGWFRLHFTVDSTLAGRPIALTLTHYGASEIFMDGRLLFANGIVSGRDATRHKDPQNFPFVFTATAGLHTIAVRYANWDAVSHMALYTDTNPGFTMRVSEANSQFNSTFNRMLKLSSLCMLLTGIFFALFLLHLLFFLYYRTDKSNLWFSLFSLLVAYLFASPFIINLTPSPRISLTIEYCSFYVSMLACFSLSGFLNSLFSRSSVRFWIVSVLCLVTCITFAIAPDYEQPTLALVTVVTLEAIFLIVRAVYRKEPGARIIGTGLMLLILILLVVMIFAITGYSFSVKSRSGLGLVILVLIALTILSIPISMSAYLARNFSAISKSLKARLIQVQELSDKALAQEAEKQQLLQNRKEELELEVSARTKEVIRQKEEIEHQHLALKAEKKKTDDLLLNILPEEVAEELKESGKSAARLYDNVTVLFTDFVDFTQISEHLTPSELVEEIDHCFKAFDAIIEKYNLEKIKTVGDAYIAVSGLPVTNSRHAQSVVDAALAIRDFIEDRRPHNPNAFTIRLGVHSGPVVAGIVGIKKFAYDIWGDTVNTAARMEQHSEAGKVNISAATYKLISPEFTCTYRGELEAKHKGKMGMYFVDRIEVGVA